PSDEVFGFERRPRQPIHHPGGDGERFSVVALPHVLALKNDDLAVVVAGGSARVHLEIFPEVCGGPAAGVTGVRINAPRTVAVAAVGVLAGAVAEAAWGGGVRGAVAPGAQVVGGSGAVAGVAWGGGVPGAVALGAHVVVVAGAVAVVAWGGGVPGAVTVAAGRVDVVVAGAVTGGALVLGAVRGERATPGGGPCVVGA